MDVRRISFSVLGLMILSLGLRAGEKIDLVRDGKAACAIVIAKDTTPSAQLAALEIQSHALKMTGAEIPICTDEQPVSGTKLFVGESEGTRRLGWRAQDFPSQEYLIAAREGSVVLMGRDWKPSQSASELRGRPMSGGDSLPETRHRIRYWQAVGILDRDQGEIELPGIYDDQGTCLATYDFLERHGGVRWYAPNELGTIISVRKNWSVDIEEVRRAPALKLRLGLESGNWPFMQKQWGEVLPGQIPLFWRRLRLGGERWSGNHTFHRQTISTLFTDPEYQSRNLLGKGSQLCYCNPKLIQQVAQMARDYFDGKGDLPIGWKALGDYFALVPDDNSHFCTCPKCKPLLQEGDAHRTLCFNNGKASNYWFTFVNAVAREVRKTHPDKYIATLGYWMYAVPPDFPIEPNVSIAPCVLTCTFPPNAEAQANDMGMYRQWLTKTDAPMFMWVYYHHPMEACVGRDWKCFPHIMVHPTAEYAKGFIRDGVRGIFVCGEQDQLEFYVMCRVWDDPETDVDAVIDQFFCDSFGEAADPMKRFYLRLEEIVCDRSNYPPKDRRHDLTDWRAVAWKHLGTPERLKELGNLIDEADRKTLTPPQRERLARWKASLWDWMMQGRAEYEAEAGRS